MKKIQRKKWREEKIITLSYYILYICTKRGKNRTIWKNTNDLWIYVVVFEIGKIWNYDLRARIQFACGRMKPRGYTRLVAVDEWYSRLITPLISNRYIEFVKPYIQIRCNIRRGKKKIEITKLKTRNL